MAVLFAADEARAQWFGEIKENQVQILSGNKQVATAVANGQLDWGLTDTDDALGQMAAGFPVTIVFPDQDRDGQGTLVIPNTHWHSFAAHQIPKGAKKLIDHLLSAKVETELAPDRAVSCRCEKVRSRRRSFLTS